MAGVFAASHFDPRNYAKHRNEYPEVLYEAIFMYHAENARYSDNKQLNVDLGCGSGQVAKVMAKHFTKVLATDPSESMLETCRSLLAEKNDNVEFRIGTAENLPFVQDSSVDMISAGTAAVCPRFGYPRLSATEQSSIKHWFPPDWWTEASRICKKGATVAIFTIQGFYIRKLC